MADLPNRDELERQWARKVGGLQRAQLGRLLEALGDPPKIDNVPSSFWDEVGRELAGIIAPFLEDIYLQQAKRLMEKNPVGGAGIGPGSFPFFWKTFITRRQKGGGKKTRGGGLGIGE